MPTQCTWDPVGRSFYLVEEAPHDGRTIHQFDADLNYVGEREPVVEPWIISTLAVRTARGQKPSLYFIIREGRESERFFLKSEAVDGQALEEIDISMPPETGSGWKDPVGLTWHPELDVFYYLERRSQTCVEMDIDGTTLRTFPLPDAPSRRSAQNRGLTFLPETNTLLATTASGSDLFPTRMVEFDLSGSLTGREIPIDAFVRVILRAEERLISGIVFAEGDVVAISRGGGNREELLRLELPAGPPPARFLRGDADGSLELGLSDPVFLLNFLFLGRRPLDCSDAGDADDDGALAVTDAIYVLNFLFLGGAPPPAPGQSCGEDPSPDGLPACEGGCP